jgi:diguanylate cyclase (GGDEF)-like protein/PAS domain S-box-containing protein
MNWMRQNLLKLFQELDINFYILIVVVIVIVSIILLYNPIRRAVYNKTFIEVIRNFKKPVMILQFHKDQFYFYEANDAYLEITGQTREELVGKKIDALFESSVANKHQQNLLDVKNKGGHGEFVTTIHTKKGTLLAKFFYTGLKLPSQSHFYSISFDDLTALKQDHDELKLVTNRLTSVLSLATNVGFVEINLINKQVWISSYFYTLFELDVKQNNPLLSFDEVRELLQKLKIMINDKKAHSLRPFLIPGKKRVSCILPLSKRLRYYELEILKQNKEFLYISIIDVTDRTEEALVLKNRLKYNPLSGFINRDYLNEEIKQRIKKYPNHQGVLAYVDIEEFKKINNRHGHSFGDKVIKAFSEAIEEKANRIGKAFEVVLSHKAGDEFIVYAHATSKIDISIQDVMDLVGNTTMVLKVDQSEVQIQINVGIAIYGKDTTDIAQLIEYGDSAIHQAKKDMLSHIKFHDLTAYEAEKSKKDLLSLLSEIIEKRDWYHVYQPILDFQTASFIGYEALARPHKVSISELLDLAYEVGAFKKLELALYLSALEDFATKGETERYVSINEGPYDIFNGNKATLDHIDQIIQEAQIKIVVEITEYTKMDIEEVQLKINRLREYNSEIAIDDFGSGYSNELALLALNPTYIKIDRGLIENIDQDERKQLLVSNIVRYAGNQIFVIAEGVETKEELKKVIELGIDGAQGYYIQKPDRELKEIPKALQEEVREIQNQLGLLVY